MDYVLWRQCNLKEIGDCKVVVGDRMTGGEEDGEDKGRAEDEVVEAEKERVLCGFKRGV